MNLSNSKLVLKGLHFTWNLKTRQKWYVFAGILIVSLKIFGRKFWTFQNAGTDELFGDSIKNNQIHEQRKHTRPSSSLLNYLLKSLTVIFSRHDLESWLVSWPLFRKLTVIAQYLLYPISTHGNDSVATTSATWLADGCDANPESIFSRFERVREPLEDLLGTRIIQSYELIYKRVVAGWEILMVIWRCA